MAAAARRPPRIVCETRYEPARPPVSGLYPGKLPGEQLAVFDVGGRCPGCGADTRPRNRVIDVPIMPSGSAAALIQQQPDPERFIRRVQLRAEEWGFTADNTRVRWWSWKPVGEGVTPEKYNVMGRCRAYAERARFILKQCAHLEETTHNIDEALARHAASYLTHTLGLTGQLQYLIDWLTVVIEDVETLWGMP